ncbi:hypothetical protein OH492_13475 [Vibrio chagasii]|nr:hypothetical protein [Vibrio chagasii]
MYPSGQLGGETELLQSTQEGMLTMTMVSGAYSKLCKEANVLEILIFFPSAPVAKVLDGEFGQQLNEQCLKCQVYVIWLMVKRKCRTKPF